MKVRSLTGLCAVSILITALPATAQLGGQNGGQSQFNRQQQRPQRRNYLPELKTIVEAIAKKADARIVVDPALFVAANPTAPAASLTVDKALDQLSSGIRNSAWRRVYLKASQAAVLPPAEKLAASVRALDQLEQTGLVLENPAAKKATTFVKNYDITPSFADDLQAGQFAPTPVYVLYSLTSKPEAQTLGERYADLQREQMQMMMQMTPDELSESMNNGLQMFMNMDPNVRQQMMGTMMKAGMQMFMNMSPDQRNQLLQGIFPGGLPGGGGGFQPPRRP